MLTVLPNTIWRLPIKLQLNFAVALTAYKVEGEWQNKKVALKSIAVQKASVPQAINVANGDITWSTPVTFKVPGISEAAIAAQLPKWVSHL